MTDMLSTYHPIEPSSIVKQILNELSEPIVAVDHQFNILYFNEACERELFDLFNSGLKVGENIIEKLEDIPDFQVFIKEKFQDAFDNKFTEENHILQTNQRYLTCQFVFYPLLNESGQNIGGFTKAILLEKTQNPTLENLSGQTSNQDDDSDLRTVINRMSYNENLLKSLSESFNYGFWICNIKGDVIYLSDSFLKLIDMSLYETKNFGWTKSLHPDDLESTMKNWFECIDGKEKEWDSEHRIIDHDGNIHYILTRGRPILDSHDNVICWCGINLDITDRKEADILLESLKNNLESEVEKRTQQLKQQRQNLRSLVKQISIIEQKERKKIADDLHDYLAQMLVIGNMSLRNINKKLPENVQILIQKDMDQLQQIVNDSLSFTRNIIKELTPQSLYREGLIPAIYTLANNFEKNDLKVHVETNHVKQICLIEDSLLLLYQSIREILFNVLKHAETNEVYVEFDETDNHELFVKIHDHGIGFDVEKAFEKSVQNGHYGLFTIQERIKAIHGKLDVISTPNQGSKFLITVPLDLLPDEQNIDKNFQNQLDQITKEGTISSGDKKNTIKLILADDASIVRHGLVNLIEDIECFEVIGEAENGQEAYEKCVELKPDIVLMDVNMPILNGIQATERIKQDFPMINVIGLSVNNDLYSSNTMLKAGASAYLPKDGEPEELFETIRTVYLKSKKN